MALIKSGIDVCCVNEWRGKKEEEEEEVDEIITIITEQI